jgi:hypothetical protein
MDDQPLNGRGKPRSSAYFPPVFFGGTFVEKRLRVSRIRSWNNRPIGRAIKIELRPGQHRHGFVGLIPQPLCS